MPVPPPAAPVPPVVPVGAGVVPVEAGVVPVEAGVVPVEPGLVVVDELVEVVLELELDAGAIDPVGTVKVGAPEVSVDPEPPPQPAEPSASVKAARIPSAVRGLGARWLISSPGDLRTQAAPFVCRNVGSR